MPANSQYPKLSMAAMPATNIADYKIELMPPTIVKDGREGASKKDENKLRLRVPYGRGKSVAKPFFRKLIAHLNKAAHDKSSIVVQRFNNILDPEVDPDVRRKFFWHLCNLGTPIKTDNDDFDVTNLKTWFELERKMELIGGYKDEIEEVNSKESIANQISDNLRKMAVRKSDHGHRIRVDSLYEKHAFTAIQLILLLRAKRGLHNPYTGDDIAEILNDLEVSTAKNGVWDQSAISKKYNKVMSYRKNFKSDERVGIEFSIARDKVKNNPNLFLRSGVEQKGSVLSMLINDSSYHIGESSKAVRENVPVHLEPLESGPGEEQINSILKLTYTAKKLMNNKIFILLICNSKGDAEVVRSIQFNAENRQVAVDLWKDLMLNPGLYHLNVVDPDTYAATEVSSKRKVTGYAPLYEKIKFGEELFVEEYLNYANEQLGKKPIPPTFKLHATCKDQEALIDGFRDSGSIPSAHNHNVPNASSIAD